MSFRPPIYDRHVKTFALCVKGNLAYFYEEAKAREFIATMQQKAPEIRNPAVIAIEGTLEHKRKTPSCLRVANARTDGRCT